MNKIDLFNKFKLGKPLKKIILPALFFFLFFCYAAPDVFERKLFFNELFALCGFFIFLFTIDLKNIFKKTFRIYDLILLLLLLSVIQLVRSLFTYEEIYPLLRSSVLVYSIFVFFIGYYLYQYKDFFLHLHFNFFRYIIALGFIIPLPFHGLSISVLSPYFLRKNKLLYQILTITIISLLTAWRYKGATLVLLSIIILIFLIKKYNLFKYLVSLLSVLIIIFIFSQTGNVTNWIKKDTSSSSILHRTFDHIDAETKWRIAMWNYILVRRFPDYITGIGFGTKTFQDLDFIPGYTKIPAEKKAFYPYIFSPHNSYIYICLRLGILSVILLLLIYQKVFSEYFKFKNDYLLSEDIYLFHSFFIISFIAVLNVVLESPIHVSYFWFFLGMTAAAIDKRRLAS